MVKYFLSNRRPETVKFREMMIDREDTKLEQRSFWNQEPHMMMKYLTWRNAFYCIMPRVNDDDYDRYLYQICYQKSVKCQKNSTLATSRDLTDLIGSILDKMIVSHSEILRPPETFVQEGVTLVDKVKSNETFYGAAREFVFGELVAARDVKYIEAQLARSEKDLLHQEWLTRLEASFGTKKASVSKTAYTNDAALCILSVFLTQFAWNKETLKVQQKVVKSKGNKNRTLRPQYLEKSDEVFDREEYRQYQEGLLSARNYDMDDLDTFINNTVLQPTRRLADEYFLSQCRALMSEGSDLEAFVKNAGKNIVKARLYPVCGASLMEVYCDYGMLIPVIRNENDQLLENLNKLLGTRNEKFGHLNRAYTNVPLMVSYILFLVQKNLLQIRSKTEYQKSNGQPKKLGDEERSVEWDYYQLEFEIVIHDSMSNSLRAQLQQNLSVATVAPANDGFMKLNHFTLTEMISLLLFGNSRPFNDEFGGVSIPTKFFSSWLNVADDQCTMSILEKTIFPPSKKDKGGGDNEEDDEDEDDETGIGYDSKFVKSLKIDCRPDSKVVSMVKKMRPHRKGAMTGSFSRANCFAMKKACQTQALVHIEKASRLIAHANFAQLSRSNIKEALKTAKNTNRDKNAVVKKQLKDIQWTPELLTDRSQKQYGMCFPKEVIDCAKKLNYKWRKTIVEDKDFYKHSVPLYYDCKKMAQALVTPSGETTSILGTHVVRRLRTAVLSKEEQCKEDLPSGILYDAQDSKLPNLDDIENAYYRTEEDLEIDKLKQTIRDLERKVTLLEAHAKEKGGDDSEEHSSDDSDKDSSEQSSHNQDQDEQPDFDDNASSGEEEETKEADTDNKVDDESEHSDRSSHLGEEDRIGETVDDPQEAIEMAENE